MDINELYVRHIKALSPVDQRRLLARVVEGLREGDSGTPPEHSLLELEGIGAELWQGIDAQTYTHALREEWEHPL